MSIQQFLKNLQEKPESTRKVILWSVVVVVSIILLVFWLSGVKSRVRNFQQSDFLKESGVSELQQTIKSLPKIEIPEIKIPELSEEELNKLNIETQNLEDKQDTQKETNL